MASRTFDEASIADRGARPFMPSPETWVVAISPQGANVFACANAASPTARVDTQSPSATWRLEPEIGMQLGVASDARTVSAGIEAHLARLVAGLLGVAQAGDRFRHLVIVAAEDVRRQLHTYLNAPTKHCIVAECGLPLGKGLPALEAHLASAVSGLI